MTEEKTEKQDYGGPWDGGVVGLLARYMVLSGLIIADRIPLSVSYGILDVIIRGIALVKPGTRKVVADNLRAVLNAPISDRELKELVRKNMRITWADRQVELVSAHRFDKAFIDEHVEIVGFEHFQKAEAEGRGVLLLSFHMGSPMILMFSLLPVLGYSTVTPGRRIFDEVASYALIERIERYGGKVIFSDDAYPALIEQLEAGDTISLMGDHLTSPRGIRVTYFGRETLMPAGPGIIAYRTRCALVPCYCVVLPNYKYRAVFGEPIDIPPTPEHIQEKDLVEVADRYIPFFEDAIRKYPENWETYFSAWPKSFDEKDLEEFWTTYGVMT